MIDRDHSAACFICRCEEVLAADVRRAIGEGALTVNDVKRRTKAGMGLCQGIFCVSTIAAMIAAEWGERLELAPMTARPPVRPIPLPALAGLSDDGV